MTKQEFKTLHPDLWDATHEWIAEGWGLQDDPSEEQLAAALLMEADTQDECVKAGDSVKEFPARLRKVAFSLLKNHLLKALPEILGVDS